LPLLQRPHLWGLGLGSFALGLVNGALVISAGIGWVAYKQLLSLSPQQWATLKQQVEQALPLPRSWRQQALVLSLLLAASTYTMTSLWQATHSVLMAMVLLGQTTLTLFIVGLLLRSGGSFKKSEKSRYLAAKRQAATSPALGNEIKRMEKRDSLEQHLGLLSHEDPLKRLVAVRRLVKLVDGIRDDRLYAAGANVSLRSHLLDCFHIMLAHEPEPIVRTAVREGLALLRQTHQLPEGPPPLPSDKLVQRQGVSEPDHKDQIRPAIRQGHRSTVEYVEYVEP
jgi:hypothetical protein